MAPWGAPAGPPGGVYNVAPAGWPAPPAPSSDGLGVAAFVLSLVWLAGLGSIAAIVLGHVSRHRAKASGREPSGLALAGLILGYVGVALPLGLVLLIGIGASAAQRDLGYQAAMKSDLKSASIAEESYAVDNDGRYTQNLSDVEQDGLTVEPHDTVTVISTQDSGYCLAATSTKSSAVWYFSSDDGFVSQISCG